ncbi:MAG: hypothetical protein M1469_01290 [Bacteroidetes bacterium]|nr:hypothetical protein [Bacteroidota bacterium]
MSAKRQIVAYSVDSNAPEQIDFTSELAEVGWAELQVERDQYEFSGGDAKFTVKDDHGLYGLLKDRRQLKVDVIFDDNLIYRGVAYADQTTWDPAAQKYMFNSYQLTKPFRDAAKKQLVNVGALNLQSVLVNSGLVSSVLGNLKDAPLIIKQDFTKQDGTTLKNGSLTDFAKEYNYSVYDFLLDAMKYNSGAYWIDNEGVLHVGRRYVVNTYTSGLDDRIVEYKETLRESSFDWITVSVNDGGSFYSAIALGRQGELWYRIYTIIATSGVRLRDFGETRYGAGWMRQFVWKDSKSRNIMASLQGNILNVDAPSVYPQGGVLFFPMRSTKEAVDNLSPILATATQKRVKLSEIIQLNPLDGIVLRGTNNVITGVLYNLAEESTTVTLEDFNTTQYPNPFG